MKRNFLILGLCLVALAFTAPSFAAENAKAHGTVAATGSSTVGNPDGVKKGSGSRTILTLRSETESGAKLA